MDTKEKIILSMYSINIKLFKDSFHKHINIHSIKHFFMLSLSYRAVNLADYYVDLEVLNLSNVAS